MDYGHWILNSLYLTAASLCSFLSCCNQAETVAADCISFKRRRCGVFFVCHLFDFSNDRMGMMTFYVVALIGEFGGKRVQSGYWLICPVI